MERPTSQLSEKEVAEKVIFLHDVENKGFRKVSTEMRAQGIPMNKDKANMVYRAYSKRDDASLEMDEELKRLKENEEETIGRIKLEREKLEVQRRLTILYIEKETLTFAKRKRFFANRGMLLRFAQKVMPITCPEVWDELKEYCSMYGYDLADATGIALGGQKTYEDKQAQDASMKQRLDLYLRDGINECLNSWRADDPESKSSEPETEVSMQKWQEERKKTEERREEMLQASDDTEEYVDNEGYVHIWIDCPEDFSY